VITTRSLHKPFMGLRPKIGIYANRRGKLLAYGWNLGNKIKCPLHGRSKRRCIIIC
jgi:hypothetical protein